MSQVTPQIHESWLHILNDEFQAPYFADLKRFLVEEKKRFTVYPQGKDIFNAFNKTPLPNVRVVILGQDPYHGRGQAHGLCFSVQDGIKPPPSLVNIFKELHTDIGITVPLHGNLGKWAEQGVFLLNATLTVRAANAGSHQGKGWEQFTDAVIKKISHEKANVVFMLWGKYAQDKAILVNRQKHLILIAPHPSPYSADRGFFGCKHFSKANEYLKTKGLGEIDWQL